MACSMVWWDNTLSPSAIKEMVLKKCKDSSQITQWEGSLTGKAHSSNSVKTAICSRTDSTCEEGKNAAWPSCA